MGDLRAIRWGSVLLALALPLLGPVGCTSNPPQFMGSNQPDAYHPTAGDSLRSAGMQVGVVVGAVLLAVGTLGLLWWLSSDDDDDPLGPEVPGWED